MYYSRPSRRSPRPLATDEDTDYDYEDQQIVFDLRVYDEEDVDTGLVDQDGNEIYRSERVPLGFLADHL